MENIFKNAKFGDRFITRGNKMALYLYKMDSISEESYCHVLNVEPNHLVTATNNGLVHYKISNDDIIDKYNAKFNNDNLQKLTWYDVKELIKIIGDVAGEKWKKYKQIPGVDLNEEDYYTEILKRFNENNNNKANKNAHTIAKSIKQYLSINKDLLLEQDIDEETLACIIFDTINNTN